MACCILPSASHLDSCKPNLCCRSLPCPGVPFRSASSVALTLTPKRHALRLAVEARREGGRRCCAITEPSPSHAYQRRVARKSKSHVRLIRVSAIILSGVRYTSSMNDCHILIVSMPSRVSTGHGLRLPGVHGRPAQIYCVGLLSVPCRSSTAAGSLMALHSWRLCCNFRLWPQRAKIAA